MKKEIPWFAEGCSGKFQKVVFYQRNGKTFVRKAAKGYNKIPSPQQELVRTRFCAATSYAKFAMTDPATKAWFAERARGQRTAYAQAISDYMMGRVPEG